jgi:branched-chain amino acid transport system permease protein/neutral amino acid transport system permease protein
MGEILLASIGFGVITVSILSLASVGFTLQFSVTGVLNLAYADVMTIAGFSAWVLNHTFGWTIWATIPVAGLVAGLLSVLINRAVLQPLMRRGTGMFGMLIATLALSLILWNGLLAVVRPGFFFYDLPPVTVYRFLGQILTSSQLILMGLAGVTLLAVHLVLTRSKLGKAMRGVAANPDLARVSGIPSRQVVDTAWFISGFLGGMAGVALFASLPVFDTTTARGLLVFILATVILGGVGNVYGALAGAVVIGISSEMVAALASPQWRDVLALVVLVVILLIRPQGIVRDVTGAREVAPA